jgi:hypothetical protein
MKLILKLINVNVDYKFIVFYIVTLNFSKIVDNLSILFEHSLNNCMLNKKLKNGANFSI